MSDEAPAAPAEAAAAPTPKGKMILIVAAVAGCVLGGGVGAVALAPKLIAHNAAAAAAKAEKKKNEPAPAARVFRLDNVIVNPAGSAGARFLMASVAFQVEDEAAETALKNHEVELRDRVVGTLESMSLASLTQAHARDSLKISLAHTAESFLPPKTDVVVFLPQFVIQ